MTAPRRLISLICTVPIPRSDLMVAVQLDPETAATVAIGGLAETAGSELDELARQIAALVNVALRRGATLEEILAELPATGRHTGVEAQLAGTMLREAIDRAARAKAAHPTANQSQPG